MWIRLWRFSRNSCTFLGKPMIPRIHRAMTTTMKMTRARILVSMNELPKLLSRRLLRNSDLKRAGAFRSFQRPVPDFPLPAVPRGESPLRPYLLLRLRGRFLRARRLRLSGRESGDGRTRQVDSYLARNLQLHHAIAEAHDGPVNVATGYHAVAGLQVGEHLLELLALLLLRTNDQEKPDREERCEKEKELGKRTPHAGVRR